MRVHMTSSISLHLMCANDTGLLFDGSSGAPFLKIGAT